MCSSQVISVQATSMDVVPVASSCRTALENILTPYGPAMSLAQLIGELFVHRADQFPAA
jgi:hypothetical protein